MRKHKLRAKLSARKQITVKHVPNQKTPTDEYV
jgi:hypothetical protein